ncbi:MAG: Uma2 family endonuclease [Isosphaeraceae bacterium]
MATTIATTRTTEADQCVTLRGIGWEGYRTLLRVRGERGVPKMIYLDGDLWLMSPSFLHERLKERMGRFVTEVVVGLRIRCIPAGQTTFRRQARRGGVEGDLTYYLTHAPAVSGKRQISLRTEPPPDLAIEVVYSHDASAAVEVYRRFGVPEVWINDESSLQILVRQADGSYVPSATSAALPFLKAAEILDWMQHPFTDDETSWVLEVRDWVRDVLAPRVQAANE